jgi:hypothetical protein
MMPPIPPRSQCENQSSPLFSFPVGEGWRGWRWEDSVRDVDQHDGGGLMGIEDQKIGRQGYYRGLCCMCCEIQNQLYCTSYTVYGIVL